jgi:Uma2 family endonuclease
VVEVVSPGSITTDRVTKPAQYAAAGIPAYWRVETDPDVSLTAYRLPEGSTVYAEIGTWTRGEIAHLTEPVVVDVPIGQLLPA